MATAEDTYCTTNTTNTYNSSYKAANWRQVLQEKVMATAEDMYLDTYCTTNTYNSSYKAAKAFVFRSIFAQNNEQLEIFLPPYIEVTQDFNNHKAEAWIIRKYQGQNVQAYNTQTTAAQARICKPLSLRDFLAIVDFILKA